MSEIEVDPVVKEIEANQDKIADILIKSFNYGKNVYERQIEYWEQERERSGIDILRFKPSELMRNELIREKLIEAFLEKHKGKHMKRRTVEATLTNELSQAMLRTERTGS